MRYNEFKLNEGFKEVQLKFSQEADPTEVASAFDVFKKLVSANRISGDERNIDWWGKQGWAAFIEYVTAIDERPSEAEQKSRKNKGESHVIEETAEWLIVVPLDKDASCFHGKKSDWCTTKPTKSNFESYFLDFNVTLIYFFRQSDGAMWALAVYPRKTVEYFDQWDEPLDSEEFDKQTGLDSDKYIELVGGGTEIGKKTSVSRGNMNRYLETLQGYMRKLKEMSAPRRSAKIETMLLKVKNEDTIASYFQTLYNYSGPVEVDQQLQTLVATANVSSVAMLKGVTTKTVKQLEKIQGFNLPIEFILHPTDEALAYISSKPRLAFHYAHDVIKEPWPPGEAAIATDGFIASVYAVDLINMKNSKQNKVRWPPGEAAIADDADASVRYAKSIIQGRWPPGEAAVATDAEMAYIYATEILKTRFPAAEEMLSNYEYDEENEEDYWAEYQERFDL